jgi:hypothetical protein
MQERGGISATWPYRCEKDKKTCLLFILWKESLFKDDLKIKTKCSFSIWQENVESNGTNRIGKRIGFEGLSRSAVDRPISYVCMISEQRDNYYF